MNREDKEFIAFMLLILSIICFIAFGVIYLDYASCKSKSTLLNLNFNYGVFSGCFVEVEGDMLPLDTYLERKVEQKVKVRIEK